VDGGREGASDEFAVSWVGEREADGVFNVLVPFGLGSMFGESGVVVGKILEAIRQKSSNVSIKAARRF